MPPPCIVFFACFYYVVQNEQHLKFILCNEMVPLVNLEEMGLPILSTTKQLFLDDTCVPDSVCSVCLIDLISGIVFVVHWWLFLGVTL